LDREGIDCCRSPFGGWLLLTVAAVRRWPLEGQKPGRKQTVTARRTEKGDRFCGKLAVVVAMIAAVLQAAFLPSFAGCSLFEIAGIFACAQPLPRQSCKKIAKPRLAFLS
jgi:hypothetical protein